MEGGQNFARRQIKACAAAVLQALMETGLREKEAASLVVTILNETEFINPKGDGQYSSKTVIDWRKIRHTLKLNFVEDFDRNLLYLQGITSRAKLMGGAISKEAVRDAIKLRLASFVQAFGYR